MVDSFALAAKSAEPTHYYLLLCALFRAIGGHEFDIMYARSLVVSQNIIQPM